jgi:hypothetical protein
MSNEHKRNVLAGFVYRNHHKFKKYQDIKSVTFGKRRKAKFVRKITLPIIANFSSENFFNALRKIGPWTKTIMPLNIAKNILPISDTVQPKPDMA